MLKADICLGIVIGTLVTCIVVPDFRCDFRLVAPVAINAVVLLAKSDDNDKKRHGY